MTDDQRAYQLAYTLARDNTPGASHAILSDDARRRLTTFPNLRDKPAAVQVGVLLSEINHRVNGYVATTYEAESRKILDTGEIVTGEVLRQRCVEIVAKMRPWLFEQVTPPEKARERAAAPAARSATSTQRRDLASHVELIASIMGVRSLSVDEALEIARDHKDEIAKVFAATKRGDTATARAWIVDVRLAHNEKIDGLRSGQTARQKELHAKHRATAAAKMAAKNGGRS